MTPKKILCLALLLIPFSFLTAQTSAEAAGIAIQGIARDANNTARTDANITLVFELYYLDNNSQPVEIPFPVTANLTTDAFGVFSYVLDIDPNKNAIMANRQVRLRISEGGTLISDEALQHVPYAIAANNGVPSGSIMPFLGTVPPPGWALCDGSALPTDGTAASLIALIGANTPNLNGMFLRGTGTSPVNGQDGPNLMATQEDTNKAHTHESGSLTTNETGSHNHSDSSGLFNRLLRFGGVPFTFSNYTINIGDGAFDSNGGESEPNLGYSAEIAPNGDHEHIISGSTESEGLEETRPVSYGVNYIIKL